MNWVKDLYLSPKMENEYKKIKWKIEHRAGVIQTYLIVIPMDSPNQLEIINAMYLKQKSCHKYYNDKKMVIIGIADSEETSKDIIVKIAEEVYEKTNDLKIKEFLLRKYEV